MKARDLVDVVVAAILALMAAVAAAVLPDGSVLRILLVAPALVFAPGYLLIQAFVVPAAPPARRAVHAVAAVGVSLAVVGLLTLSTAVIPGGFRPVWMVAFVTAACLGLAVVAMLRRMMQPTTATKPAPTPRHGAGRPARRPYAPPPRGRPWRAR